MNSYDFDKALKFVKDVVNGLDIGPNDVQIGLLAFDHNVHLQFHLDKFSTKQVSSRLCVHYRSIIGCFF